MADESDDSLEKEIRMMLEPSPRPRSRSRPREQFPEAPASPAENVRADLMGSDEPASPRICPEVQTVNRLLDQIEVKLGHVGAAFNNINGFSSEEKQNARQRIATIMQSLAALDRMAGAEAA